MKAMQIILGELPKPREKPEVGKYTAKQRTGKVKRYQGGKKDGFK